MANKTKELYITQTEWNTLASGGSITIGEQTISYSDDYTFFVKYEGGGGGGGVSDVKVDSTSVVTEGVANIPDGTTSAKGVVQLNDTTSSTSTTEAATANAVKLAYDHYPPSGSTSTAGILKLNNNLTSTSTALALTAAQGKALNDNKEAKGKITISGTEYTVALSTTDAGVAGQITFVVEA